MPIVNRHFLSRGNIERTANEEPFLLSAILMIATTDRADLEAENRCIWSHLQGMILAVALGSKATKCVGAVEALLLLAEWVPRKQLFGYIHYPFKNKHTLFPTYVTKALEAADFETGYGHLGAQFSLF